MNLLIEKQNQIKADILEQQKKNILFRKSINGY
jgi:hypothetical protein